MFVLVLVGIFWQFLLRWGLRLSKGRVEQGVLFDIVLPLARAGSQVFPVHGALLEATASSWSLQGAALIPHGGLSAGGFYGPGAFLLEIFTLLLLHQHLPVTAFLSLWRKPTKQGFFPAVTPLFFFLPMILIPSVTAVSPLAIPILLRGSAEVAKQHSLVNNQEG